MASTTTRRFRETKGDEGLDESSKDQKQSEEKAADSAKRRQPSKQRGSSDAAVPSVDAAPQDQSPETGSPPITPKPAPAPPQHHRARPPPLQPPQPSNAKDDTSLGTSDSRAAPPLWVSDSNPNSSPDTRALLDSGFNTDAGIFYVRSHGQHPRLTWEDHSITVDGLVERPMVLCMSDLLDSFPQVTLNAFMACVGVRRTEVKAMRAEEPAKGVDFGPTAIGNGNWTGVRLSDVLARCGAATPAQGARWVHFGGPEGEFLEPGRRYVTSLELTRCLDPAQDILLAWKQNDSLLTPGHGYPLRLVAPGIIGGRAVKWLSTITVASEDTSNYYHLHDNRVLPTEITADVAERDGWYDPNDMDKATAFVARESSVNSAILSPHHGDVILVTPAPAQGRGEGAAQQHDVATTVRGWAFSGGGRSVTHVEVSLDGGESWRLARLVHHAPPNLYGKHWSWYLWEADLSSHDVMTATEIRCRAHDSAMNTQPERPSWNLLGSSNNSHYVIKLNRLPEGEGDGEGDQQQRQHQAAEPRPPVRVMVEHPALVAVPGKAQGWMILEREREEEQAPEAAREAAKCPVSSAAELEEEARQGKEWEKLRVIPLAEVQRHTTREAGAWFIRDGKVYDATGFLEQHPGGADIILSNAGGDASSLFDGIHPESAKKLAVNYLIGRLEGAERPVAPAEQQQRNDAAAAAASPSSAAVEVSGPGAGEAVALDPVERRRFLLAEKIEVSHDTRLFRFSLLSPSQRLGLPMGKHILAHAVIDGEEVVRPYTPTTLDDDRGHFDLVVKVYRPMPPKFPRGGRMSQHLDSLVPGRDTLQVSGPSGLITYLGHGALDVAGRGRVCASHINMMAGGTGITPMYQVAKAIVQDPHDHTRIRLLFANKTPDDILIRGDLDDLARNSNGQFQVFYTVDDTAGRTDWRDFTGHINAQMARQALFPPAGRQQLAGGGGAGDTGHAGSRGGGPAELEGAESGGTAVLLCGPPPMIKFACKPCLQEMGFTNECIIEF